VDFHDNDDNARAAPPLSTKSERADTAKRVRQQVPLQAHAD
jgi:hypothetical protein